MMSDVSQVAAIIFVGGCLFAVAIAINNVATAIREFSNQIKEIDHQHFLSKMHDKEVAELGRKW